MKHLIDSVRQTIVDRNYQAALALGLALPDIAGKIDDPNLRAGARYTKWYDLYVAKHHQTEGVVSAYFGRTTFLSGRDCYALRCAFLHEGTDELSGHQVREVVDRVHFSITTGVHRNLDIALTPGTDMSKIEDMVPLPIDKSVLQLNVAEFCEEICVGLEEWLVIIATDQVKMEKVTSRIKIYQ